MTCSLTNFWAEIRNVRADSLRATQPAPSSLYLVMGMIAMITLHVDLQTPITIIAVSTQSAGNNNINLTIKTDE